MAGYGVDLHKDEVEFLRLISDHPLPDCYIVRLDRKSATTLALLFTFEFVRNYANSVEASSKGLSFLHEYDLFNKEKRT